MKIVKYSQSTFVVENKSGCRLLIDPGKYNYDNGFSPEDFGKIDVLVITHKHEDHHDTTAEEVIVRKWSPIVITNTEIAMEPNSQKFNYNAHSVGDKVDIKGFEISFVAADHFAKCEHIINFGLFIVADNLSFYHTSDTRFMETCYYNHELVKNSTVLAVPISNRGVVMGIDDSIAFTSQIEPTFVIPMHYDSPKDKTRVSPEDFVEKFEILKTRIPNLSRIKIKVLNFNETLTID